MNVDESGCPCRWGICVMGADGRWLSFFRAAVEARAGGPLSKSRLAEPFSAAALTGLETLWKRSRAASGDRLHARACLPRLVASAPGRAAAANARYQRRG